MRGSRIEDRIRSLQAQIDRFGAEFSHVEAKVSVNRCVVDTVRPVVEDMQRRLAKLERERSKGSSPVSLTACSQAAEHGWELGRRSAAREIREELHLGASWSEFRDWIGREFLGE